MSKNSKNIYYHFFQLCRIVSEYQQRRVCFVTYQYRWTILFQYQIIDKYQNFHFYAVTMISEDKVVLVERKHNRLTQIDLITHQVNYISHQFINQMDKFGQIKIHFFSETNLLCVQQQIYKYNLEKQYCQYCFIITYYLPSTLGMKLCTRYQQKMINRIKYQANKANNYSMIAWLINRFQFKLTLALFNLRDFPQGKCTFVDFQITQNLRLIGLSNIFYQKPEQYYIQNVWQKNNGEIYIAFQIHPYMFKNCSGSFRVIKCQIENSQVFETNIIFSLGPNKWISSLNIGDFCVFAIHQINLYPKQSDTLVIKYFNNKTQEIIEFDHPTRSVLLWQEYISCFQQYNPYLINYIYYAKSTETHPRDYFSVTTQYIFNWELVLLHFLVHLNQDFDDDLLKQSLELINLKTELERQQAQLNKQLMYLNKQKQIQKQKQILGPENNEDVS